MSETDDTDDLLLIPPDLFTNQIKFTQSFINTDPYFKVVDSLITQVYKLEDKVNSIAGSEVDLHHSDFDYSMDSRRKYASTDDLLTERENCANTSSFSTPQKPRVVYRRREERCMNTAGLSPQKHKKMLDDIEKFISNTVQYNTDRNNKGNDDKFPNTNKRSDDYTEANVRNKRGCGSTENNKNETSDFTEDNLTNRNKSSDDYPEDNLTNRNRISDEYSEDNYKFSSNGNRRGVNRNSEINLNSRSDLRHQSRSRDDSSKKHNNVKARINFDRKLDRIGEIDLDAVLKEVESRKLDASSGVRFLYARPLDGSVGNTDSALGDKSASGSSSSESTQTTAYNRNSQKFGGESGKLLSLSELWGRNGRDAYKEKLEEERLRREHCEELIRELQTKVLELQERVAVALKVDEAKDGALTKFHDAWEKLIFQYKNLDLERESLENENKELRQGKAAEINEYSQKLEQVEAELTKTMDSIQIDREKLMSTQKENAELKNRLSLVENDFKKLETLLGEQMEKNRMVNEILAQKEIEINENKAILAESRNEVCQCRDAIDMCQNEFTQMKQQYIQLEHILDTKQKQINDLETQKRTVLNDNENLKLIQRNLQEELIRLRDSTEKTKIELRNFYQDQVEIVVRDKLKEFQAQLDKTESSLQEEIKSREMNVAKTAAAHIHQLTEKHNLEVNLLEEKHGEEVKLYQVQLTQSQQQLEQMSVKLKKQTDTRNAILQQLKKAMEAQWNEALKIVNEGKSPVNVHDGTMDRLNHLKTKSYSNLEEVLSDNKVDENNYGSSGTSSAEFNFNFPQTTPVTTKRGFKGPRQIENDLQNYVQMLLSKHNENPEKDNSSEERFMSQEDAVKYKYRKGMKPPWK